MRLALGHGLIGLGIVCGGVAVFAACQHNDSSLFVQNVLYPTPVAPGQGCTFTNDPNQTFLTHGQLDIGFRQTYTAEFLIGNQLVSESNSQQLQTETSTININEAVVQVTTADGTQLDNFTYLTSGTVYPSTGTVPGYTPLGAVIVSQKAVSAVSASLMSNPGATQTLVTYTTFKGTTLGGTAVESNVFEFAVDVCYGCMVTYSSADVVTNCGGLTLKSPNCAGASGGGSTGATTVPCLYGEDTLIDCSLCQQDLAVCRGEYPAGTPSCDGGTD